MIQIPFLMEKFISRSRIPILAFALTLACILGGCVSSNTAWKETLARNTIEGYQDFLSSNPPENLAAQARGKMDSLSYSVAKDQHTTASFEQYLKQFPRGAFKDEAQQRLEKLVFYQETQAVNTIAAYEDFLSRFPNGTFAAEAKSRREQLFFNQQVSKTNTVDAYRGYLQQYPDGIYADSAKSRIESIVFDSVKTVDSVSAYLDYLKRYPEGTYKAEALAGIELCAFRNANTQQTIDAYEEYIREYPQGKYVSVARHNIDTRLEAYHEAKVVRVTVDQLFYEKLSNGSKDALTGISLPIESLTRRLLSDHTSADAVGPDVKKYAATIDITTEGIALGSGYGTDTLYYTGASLSGTIKFTVEGYPPFTRTFSSSFEPPPSITPDANSIAGASAPFGKVYNAPESFIPKIIEVIYKIYGTPALVSTLRDADENVRSAAIDISAMFKVDGAFNGIVNALRDNNFTVRQRAALALGIYKDSRAIDALVKNLNEILDFPWIKDQSDNAREKAAIALGMIGDSEAVKPLINALKDPSPNVRHEASVALKKITSKDLGEDFDVWTKWYEEKK